MHVQKAAGTEVRERLKRTSRPRRCTPIAPTETSSRSHRRFRSRSCLARWAVRKEQIEIITGHFPYTTPALLDADFVTLSVLREPVERVLSHLRHHRKLTPGGQD